MITISWKFFTLSPFLVFVFVTQVVYESFMSVCVVRSASNFEACEQLTDTINLSEMIILFRNHLSGKKAVTLEICRCFVRNNFVSVQKIFRSQNPDLPNMDFRLKIISQSSKFILISFCALLLMSSIDDSPSMDFKCGYQLILFCFTVCFTSTAVESHKVENHRRLLLAILQSLAQRKKMIPSILNMMNLFKYVSINCVFKFLI